ncbi:MAG: hypothetical protein OWT28_04745 [Firmicutes bacterium]|nr:hypothetical protein [Bacillota bacterium]
MGTGFYHQWWYVYILNTRGFIWAVTWLVLGANLLAPILLWAIFRGKPIWNQNQQQMLTTFLSGGRSKSASNSPSKQAK